MNCAASLWETFLEKGDRETSYSLEFHILHKFWSYFTTDASQRWCSDCKCITDNSCVASVPAWWIQYPNTSIFFLGLQLVMGTHEVTWTLQLSLPWTPTRPPVLAWFSSSLHLGFIVPPHPTVPHEELSCVEVCSWAYVCVLGGEFPLCVILHYFILGIAQWQCLFTVSTGVLRIHGILSHLPGSQNSSLSS